MGDIWTWLISFFFLIALVGIIVYQLVCLADLEFDYINPYDSASRINSVVLPEFIVQGVLCVFYLITGHWFMALLCLPYLYYNFQLYSKRQHLVDVTEIFNLLNWEKKKRLFKLAYIILNLFLTIFCCSIKLYSGLKPQSASFLTNGYQNLNKEFYGRIHKSLESGTGKANRSRVKMMPIGTPRVPYRNREEGTWQWVDIWNALYRERVIFIGQNIDEEFSNQILATMLYLDTLDDSRRIYMYLNGPGGDLTPSLAIYDTMKSLKSPVGTHCVGLAYNLAGFLLAAGEKGQRFAMPLSRIALTSPAGAARGQADDIQNEAKELSRIRDYLFNELANNTGQPAERIFKDLSRVKRFNAEEAMEYGLIDKILGLRNSELMKKTVRLRSCRGKIYEIDEVVASQSKLIANYCEGGDILIEDVKDEILDLVIDYCKNHARASSSSSSSEMDLKRLDDSFIHYNRTDLYPILMAADYLIINSLLDLCFQTIADSITACQSPRQIRSKFGIVSSGFTPDEKEAVWIRNAWAEANDEDDDDDVLFDILTRMPAKSLAMGRCVSKTWASIISRPSFTALFSSRTRTHLLFVCTLDWASRFYHGNILMSPLPWTREIFGYFLDVNHQTELRHKVGDLTFTYVNGLVFDMQPSFCGIHNPSTGMSFTVRNSEVVRASISRGGDLGAQSYFGYDPISKTFKILAMTTADGISRNHCCHTVRAGERYSWRSISCGIEHFLMKWKPVCIGGHIFYPAASRSDAPISMVIDFDLNAEEFSSINYFDIQASSEAILFDYNGSLASFVLLEHLVSFALWVLEGRVKQIWVKHVHVIPNLPRDFSGHGFKFVGVIHTNETVWLQSTEIVGPSWSLPTGMFFNTDTKTVKEISFSSFGKSKRKRVGVSVGHIEYMRNPWEEYEAVALLKSSEDEEEGVKGNISFIQEGEKCPTTMALTVYGLKPGTYSISVNDVVLKTFDVHQNIPFTIEIIDDNQIPLAGEKLIFDKSVSIVTDGGHVVSKEYLSKKFEVDSCFVPVSFLLNQLNICVQNLHGQRKINSIHNLSLYNTLSLVFFVVFLTGIYKVNDGMFLL
ncbi:unnamed protein product [Brassica rapa]|uniref:ATP-dependent Clp protease proteolytic subunit n=1 Tax=Brassica campestris TaxID=3711 RepID=A0A8D9D0Y5_BRACM|nr:unnamed protein product [Brassica rapa]